MSAYYEKIVDLWKAGKEEQAVYNFRKYEKVELLSKEEIEELEKILPIREIFCKRIEKASPIVLEKIKKALGMV